MPKQKGRNLKCTIGTGVGLGVLLSVVLSLILSMLLAAVVLNERVEERMIGYLVPMITLLASLIGGIVAGKCVGEKPAIVIGVTGLMYMLVLVGAGILFFDGGFHNLWTRLLAIGISWAASCAICIRGKGAGRRRKRAYR